MIIRKKKIKKNGRIFCEANYTIPHLSTYKHQALLMMIPKKKNKKNGLIFCEANSTLPHLSNANFPIVFEIIRENS